VSELSIYAKNEFFLNSVVPGSKAKTSQRKHLEQIAKTLGKKPKELELSGSVPKGLGYLWRWYSEHLQWSTPLSFQELESWCRLTHTELSNFETEVLMLLDKFRRTSNSNV
jgi:hypothetical protein